MNTQETNPTNSPTPAPQPRPPKKDKSTNISWADVLTVAITLAWILPEIVALASQTLYTVALALKFIGILAAVFLVTNTFSDMSKGQFFTEKNSRRLTAAWISILVFFIARLGLEGMANNWAATQLGIDWWQDPGTTTPLSDLAPALVLACVLAALATALRRGAKLEEDVDGLV